MASSQIRRHVTLLHSPERSLKIGKEQLLAFANKISEFWTKRPDIANIDSDVMLSSMVFPYF